MGVCLWQKGFSNRTFAGESTERQPELESQRMSGWKGRQAASGSHRVWWLYIPEKTRHSRDKPAKCWFGRESRRQSVREGEHSWRETAENQNRPEVPTWRQQPYVSTVRHTRGLWGKVCNGKVSARSLWFLSIFLLSLLGASSTACTAHPPKHTLPLCSLPSTLQRDVQVGKGGPGGWSGVGRVKSKQIHLLPRLSSWLAVGPSPAFTQPAAWRIALTHTQLDCTHQETQCCWQVWVFSQTFFFIYIKRERISRWPSTRYSCPRPKTWPINLSEHLRMSEAFHYIHTEQTIEQEELDHNTIISELYVYIHYVISEKKWSASVSVREKLIFWSIWSKLLRRCLLSVIGVRNTDREKAACDLDTETVNCSTHFLLSQRLLSTSMNTYLAFHLGILNQLTNKHPRGKHPLISSCRMNS